jgi:hypothetical protein
MITYNVRFAPLLISYEIISAVYTEPLNNLEALLILGYVLSMLILILLLRFFAEWMWILDVSDVHAAYILCRNE